jgi:hypothetical protein
VTCCIGAYPYNEADPAIATPEQFETSRYAVWKLAGVATGSSSVSLNRSFDVERVTGVPFFDKDHWIDQTRATAASPADPHEMCLFANVSNSGVTMWSGYLDVQATYHLQWFSPCLPSGPQLAQRVREVRYESQGDYEEDDEDYPVISEKSSRVSTFDIGIKSAKIPKPCTEKSRHVKLGGY